MCPYFPQASDKNVHGGVHTKPKKFEKSGFICTARPSLHYNRCHENKALENALQTGGI